MPLPKMMFLLGFLVVLNPEPAVLTGTGYSPQCSQLYNTIDHTWTESQWTVWEQLRRDLGC